MDFVPVQYYLNYVDAHIGMGVLEAQGINCWLKDENTVTIDPILTNAVGGIKLMVQKENAQRALEVLQELRNEKKASLSCPKCGSHNIEFVSTPRKAINWISSILTFFLGDYAMAVDKVNHCFDCGHEFPREEKE
ncbi:MAG: DUF2007 domain-containing protein [Sphingobacteriales bacterium]|nr:DUF2007 domain-containing protein [Sphingobacteriales bacterium]